MMQLEPVTPSGDGELQLPVDIDALEDRVDELTAASRNPNTQRAYRQDLQRFSAWMKSNNLSEQLPISVDVVSLYIAHLSRYVPPGRSSPMAPSTVRRSITAINWIHRRAGHQRPGDDPRIADLLLGLQRERQHRPERRTPLLTEAIFRMMGQIPSYGPDGIRGRRDRLIVLLGFSGALRRSEITGIVARDIRFVGNTLTVYLRTSKNDQESRGTTRGIPQGGIRSCCPVCAYVEWIEVLRAIQDGRDPRDIVSVAPPGTNAHVCARASSIPVVDIPGTLIRSVRRWGTVSPLPIPDSAINRILKERSLESGIDPTLVGGHSLRAGFVTQAYLNGATDHQIIRQTGHRTRDMLDVYSRESAPLMNNAATNLGL